MMYANLWSTKLVKSLLPATYGRIVRQKGATICFPLWLHFTLYAVGTVVMCLLVGYVNWIIARYVNEKTMLIKHMHRFDIFAAFKDD